jgi:hypothetical protein
VNRPATARVALQGWLHKQGSEGLMLWKKRWFVLSEYCLFYYKGTASNVVCLRYNMAAVGAGANLSRDSPQSFMQLVSLFSNGGFIVRQCKRNRTTDEKTGLSFFLSSFSSHACTSSRVGNHVPSISTLYCRRTTHNPAHAH